MTPDGTVDLHIGSGNRKLTGEEDDETKGYGLRGCNLLCRGHTTSKKAVVHCIDSLCKSHRLQVRSSYAAEALAAAHSLDECYPPLITLHELKYGKLYLGDLKSVR